MATEVIPILTDMNMAYSTIDAVIYMEEKEEKAKIMVICLT